MNSVKEAKQLLSDCLFIPEEHIDENAEINSLTEIDSLTFELIVIELEKRIGHEVDPVTLLEMRSVKDIAVLLEVKV